MTMKVYTVEKIGPKQAMTPDGFLLCSDVPLARTGRMQYGPGETPIDVGPDGTVTVMRDDAEVFRVEFILSLAGKPVVNDHPPRDVNPANWKEYSVGTLLNPRRGTGEQSDLLIGDLLICDADAIKDVRAGKREVSLGYDSDYDELAPGQARQKNMMGNHVALVDQGRCGSRCSIADAASKAFLTGDCAMSKDNRKTAWQNICDRIAAAFKAKDEAGIQSALEDAGPLLEGGEDSHIHIHNSSPAESQPGGLDGANMYDAEATENRFRGIEDALGAINTKLGIGGDSIDPGLDTMEGADSEAVEELEGNLADEAPTGKEDEAKKAKDSAFLGDSFQETLASAEILVPGIKAPKYTKDEKPKVTLDALCGLRRTALDLAYHQPDTRGMIDTILAGKPLDLSKMSCKDTRSLFRAAAAMKKAANTNDHTRVAEKPTPGAGGGLGLKGPIRTPADLNAVFKKHYGPREPAKQ